MVGQIRLQFVAQPQQQAEPRPEADLVLEESAVQTVGSGRWNEGDAVASRERRGGNPIPQPPYDVVAVPCRNVMLEIKIEGPAYLGHAHVTDTYWYLTATPELLHYVMQRVQRSREQRP